MQGFAKYVRPAFRQRQQELAELNAILNDNLSGIREIQAFTREDVEEILNLQPKGQRAKPYQVKQVRRLILRYRLGEDDA